MRMATPSYRGTTIAAPDSVAERSVSVSLANTSPTDVSVVATGAPAESLIRPGQTLHREKVVEAADVVEEAPAAPTSASGASGAAAAAPETVPTAEEQMQLNRAGANRVQEPGSWQQAWPRGGSSLDLPRRKLPGRE